MQHFEWSAYIAHGYLLSLTCCLTRQPDSAVLSAKVRVKGFKSLAWGFGKRPRETQFLSLRLKAREKPMSSFQGSEARGLSSFCSVRFSTGSWGPRKESKTAFLSPSIQRLISSQHTLIGVCTIKLPNIWAHRDPVKQMQKFNNHHVVPWIHLLYYFYHYWLLPSIFPFPESEGLKRNEYVHSHHCILWLLPGLWLNETFEGLGLVYYILLL